MFQCSIPGMAARAALSDLQTRPATCHRGLRSVAAAVDTGINSHKMGPMFADTGVVPSSTLQIVWVLSLRG